MALRKQGKYWHVYFRVDGKIISKSTGETNRKDAIKLEDMERKRLRSIRALKRFGVLPSVEPKKEITPKPKQTQIKLADLFDIAAKYRKLSRWHEKFFKRFCEECGCIYAIDVTPKKALDFLTRNYGDGNGKSFNNAKTYINTIFKASLVDAGLASSPFESVLSRRLGEVEGHRRLTSEEFEKIFTAAKEPWKTAALISWYTGLRKSDCFSLCWNDIDEKKKAIIKIPGKTSRYARSVYVPIHPRLWTWLQALPRPESPEMPILKCNLNSGHQADYLRELFGILPDTADGKVSFHSLRASFITRCDEAGIPRHAIRGVVGHTSENTTNMYSQDTKTAEKIRDL